MLLSFDDLQIKSKLSTYHADIWVGGLFFLLSKVYPYSLFMLKISAVK